ncbi:hypothetical protein AJ80_06197 [Polytolypa hystricis UAMH7299]|uniref:Chromosome segregation in meiosis protein n=1 Tax=Polytolypa hystricis (strain UAMH7299) TaxID=1447883 RepID=A0A2B7XYJ3_POLH7|nr:hypothetical protein AJ80_06197 [Polytolypa hystricis UAMH7299]
MNNTETIDDLFDYGAGLDDILKDTEAVPQNPLEGPNQHDGEAGADALGLDEELKVSRKRNPVAKLDEARLLSQAGIPKLRKTARTKLKFKGKGHEFSDAVRLLNLYQLWLDDLYPRAKFADGLTMIEKLGHSKRIQVMRREWIDEGKPKPLWSEGGIRNNEAKVLDRTTHSQDALEPAATGNDLDESRVNEERELGVPNSNGWGEENPQAAPLALDPVPNGSIFNNKDNLFLTDDEDIGNKADVAPEDDELDALLAEVNPPSFAVDKRVHTEQNQNDFDELEAMYSFE